MTDGAVARRIALGVRPQLGIPLVADDGWRIALNLYAHRRDAFDSETVSLAEMFADQAAGAMGLVRMVQTLNKALVMRETIGQAVGIVMETTRWTPIEHSPFWSAPRRRATRESRTSPRRSSPPRTGDRPVGTSSWEVV